MTAPTDPKKATAMAAAFAPLPEMGQTDSDKLIDFASTLMHLPPPTMTTRAGAEAMRLICRQLHKVARAAQDKAGAV